MDRDTIREVLPHYVAMVIILLIFFNVMEFVAGDLGFWIEIAIAFVIVTLYRPIVIRLGLAPSAWTER